MVADAVPVCKICPPAGLESLEAEIGIETFIKTFEPACTVIESDITVVKVESDFATIDVVVVFSTPIMTPEGNVAELETVPANVVALLITGLFVPV